MDVPMWKGADSGGRDGVPKETALVETESTGIENSRVCRMRHAACRTQGVVLDFQILARKSRAGKSAQIDPAESEAGGKAGQIG
jgi:hypothetical protein